MGSNQTEAGNSLSSISETMFGSSAHTLVAMKTRCQRERLVWISNQKIAELRQESSDNNLHRAVLVKNTHSALTAWKGKETGFTTSAFAIFLRRRNSSWSATDRKSSRCQGI